MASITEAQDCLDKLRSISFRIVHLCDAVPSDSTAAIQLVFGRIQDLD
jgi:hypothetical protein